MPSPISKPPVRQPSVTKKADSLRAIGDEPYGQDETGRTISRKEKLDRILWEQATGWVEETRDPAGTLHRIVHPPNITVALKLKEQLDGKAGTAAVTETRKGPSAAASVRKLAIEKLNRMAGGETV